MKKGWLVFVLFMILLTVSGAATAQPQKPATARTVYSMTDANGDTVVSVTEHAAFWQGRFKDIDADKDGKLTAAMSRRFKEIDKNRNGFISLEEHAYFMSKNAGSAKKVK